MSIQIKEIPPRQIFRTDESYDLVAGEKLKVKVKDSFVDKFEFEVPQGKVAHLRIEIRGSLSDET